MAKKENGDVGLARASVEYRDDVLLLRSGCSIISMTAAVAPSANVFGYLSNSSNWYSLGAVIGSRSCLAIKALTESTSSAVL